MNETDRLLESIITVQTVICTNCRKSNDQYYIDKYSAVEYFKDKGWRATKHSNIYCPKCSKIKLKKK